MSLQNLENYIKTAETHKSLESLTAWLLELGKHHLSDLSIRQHENFVNGCQSQTWISADCADGVWQFGFLSDAYFVQALGRIVTDTYSGLTAEQIQQITYHNFKPLASRFSIQRQRGLQAFINRVHTLTQGASQ